LTSVIAQPENIAAVATARRMIYEPFLFTIEIYDKVSALSIRKNDFPSNNRIKAVFADWGRGA
jgi:hypothetical protein